MRFNRSSIAAVVALTIGASFALPSAGRGEDLFDFLFGSSDAPQQQSAHGRSAGGGEARGKSGERRGGGGQGEISTGGYCVRTCDGYYFPLIKSSQATRQQSCEYACPSAPMELYDGSSIETARNYKGERYAALPTAFSFREKATPNCTCNDPQSSQTFSRDISKVDPTLKSGDVVIEDNGVFVYTGSNLVPMSSASFMSAQSKQRVGSMLRRNTVNTAPTGPTFVPRDEPDDAARAPAAATPAAKPAAQ